MKVVICVLSILACVLDVRGTGNNQVAYKRVCYYRYPSPLKATDITPNLCTHYNFAFTSVINSTVVPAHAGDAEGYKSLLKYKHQNPSVKILFSVGGAGNADGFHKMVSSPENRMKFIKQSINFTKYYKFDGIDFDWEFPKGRDVDLFGDLLTQFRDYLNENKMENFLLTAALESDLSTYNVPSLIRNLDFMNVMTYDFNSYYKRHYTAFNSPLYREIVEKGYQKAANIDFNIRKFLMNGIPSEKLILGFPTYGRGYHLANNSNHGFNAKAVGDGGTLAYSSVCKVLKSGGNRVFDEWSKVPYAYLKNMWYSYDDGESYREKCKYIKKMNLGGAMTWVLDSDDWNNECGEGKFPLHSVLKNML